jgi:hypothetical protein
MTFQFNVQIRDIKSPTIWRDLLVPANFSFHHFHNILQVAFGWDNTHLYEFSPEGMGSSPGYGLPDDFTGTVDKNSTRFLLSDHFTSIKQQIIYTYDFGDCWEHIITLEDIHKTPTRYATCFDGEGACPPEDCGGVLGYKSFKKILNDPLHKEYDSMRVWIGLRKRQLWNANKFKKKETSRILQDM